MLPTVTAGLLLALPFLDAHAQSLAQRVRAVRDGTMELRFAARPGVCGDGLHYFSIGRSMHVGSDVWVNGSRSNAPCLPGPVRVRLQATDGAVRVERFDVGPTPPRQSSSSVTDLGVVPSAEAASYLLDLAGEGSSSASRGVTA